MSGWENSGRRDELPPNWPELRKAVIARDRTCRWRVGPGQLCCKPGNQVDHIIRGNDHRPENLQLLCTRHHRIKSSREGAAAAAARRRALNPPEVHPALR